MLGQSSSNVITFLPVALTIDNPASNPLQTRTSVSRTMSSESIAMEKVLFSSPMDRATLLPYQHTTLFTVSLCRTLIPWQPA